MVVSEPVSARAVGAVEPAPLNPGFYSRLFLATKATGEWRPIIDLSSLNVFVHCPSFTMEMPRSILGALQQGQWLTSLDLKDAYFHIGINPADRRYLRFCHNGTAWQIHSAAIWVVNQSESIYQNTQTGTSICPSPSGKIAQVHRRLVVKPRDTPGSSLANILTQVPVPKARVCFYLLEKTDQIPSKVATYLGIELHTLVGLARPSHKRVTNWLSIAEGFTAQQSPPAVQWLQVLGHLVALEKLVPYGRMLIRPIQWQLRLHWIQLKEKSSKLIPMDLQSRLAILWSPNRDHRYGVLPVLRAVLRVGVPTCRN